MSKDAQFPLFVSIVLIFIMILFVVLTNKKISMVEDDVARLKYEISVGKNQHEGGATYGQTENDQGTDSAAPSFRK